MAVAGYQGALLLTSPPSVALPTNMALVDSGDHQTFAVGVSNATYRYWDQTATFTFQTAPDGVTWSSATPASVQYVNGKVRFASAIVGATPSARVTAGSYFPYAVLANITGWTFDGQMGMADATTLTGGTSGGGGNPAKAFLPTLLEGTFSITKFWIPESSVNFFSYITSATPLILAGVDGNGNRLEGYAYDKKLSLKVDVSKLVDETLEFQVSGPFYGV